MRSWTLIRRGLVHFRAEGLAVAAGVAVATAVLTGALLVGDSVRGSLRDLVLERLGPIDYVVVDSGFFGASLADRLAGDEAFRGEFGNCSPALVVRGTASDEAGRRRAARVDIFGLAGGENLLDLGSLPRGSCILNDALGEELGVAAGATVLLRLPTSPDIPRSVALGRRDRATSALRLTVARVEGRPGRPVGLASAGPLRSFSLYGTQRVPRNAWVRLEDLQEAAEQPGRANVLFVAARPGTKGAAAETSLARHLERVAGLDDYGLELRRYTAAGVASLESRQLYLSDAVVAAGRAAAAEVETAPTTVLVNLATTIENAPHPPSGSPSPSRGDRQVRAGVRVGPSSQQREGAPQTFPHPKGLPEGERGRSAAGGGYPTRSRMIPYSIVAGIDPVPGGPVEADEIVLNEWAARDLEAAPGALLRLVYAVRQPNGEVVQVGEAGSETVFRLARVVPTAGLGADRTLTPAFKGITDSLTMATWDPPPDLSIDPARIGPRDEAYWHAYRAAPKAFIRLDVAQRLWPSTLGPLTSLRVPIDEAADFEAALRRRLVPERLGMVVRPLRAEQLAAAGGSTDFGQLFLGFSFFLIVSAALLVAMLFRLAVERRAGEIGLLLAVGFSGRDVRRQHLAGGMLLAAAGGVVGLGVAVGYAWLMLAGLRTWWIEAVGSSFARLHVEGISLAIGYLAGLAVSYLTIRWAVRQVARTEASVLLAGGFIRPEPRASSPEKTRSPGRPASRPVGRRPRLAARGSWLVASLAAALAVGLMVLAAMGAVGPAAGFFGAGVALLAGAVAGLLAHLKAGRRVTVSLRGPLALERLGVRNAARHPTRSVLTAGLIASAAFVIVTVAAMRQGRPGDTLQLGSGAGGFNLIAETDIPLQYDLAVEQSRAALALADLPEGAEFVSLGESPGEDVSCLNLFRPSRPRILGVPDGLVERGGFAFAAWEGAAENPWELLRRQPLLPSRERVGARVRTGSGPPRAPLTLPSPLRGEGEGEAGPSPRGGEGEGGAAPSARREEGDESASAPADADEIPAIADAATAQWILHLGLGDTVAITDEAGADRRLRLVALLRDSIFQGELLISQADFDRLFPRLTGFNTVLIRAEAEAEAVQVKRALETALADFGVAVDWTADRLALYTAVADTYLSTFQTLGGLGLVLGTVGLGVVLLRGLFERRGELALLMALGFSGRAVLRTVLAENVFLLAAGLAAGTLSALLAVAPQVASGASQANWPLLALTLAAVAASGLVVLGAAVVAGLRRVTVADLGAE